MIASGEQDLLGQALSLLSDLLPEEFRLERQSSEPAGHVLPPGDAVWLLRTNDLYTKLLVQAKRSLAPRDVDQVLGGLPDLIRQELGQSTVLVVAPWLSPRTRERLEERDYSYADLTGNVRLRTRRPPVYLRLHGSDQDPTPPERSLPQLHGPKARRLARLLVDVMPPYRMTDLARLSGLNQGYVSRLLDSLHEQALIERGRRGCVEHVDWPALLAASAERYDLLKSNATTMFVAPAGATALHTRLAAGEFPGTVVTGSYAAAAVAPIAAPAQLALYSTDSVHIRRHAGLLPAERGADVLLLNPADPSQVERTRTVKGATHVGLSQLVIDSLTGNGRMPEEGEAVLDWMRRHEDQWRLAKLPTTADQTT